MEKKIYCAPLSEPYDFRFEKDFLTTNTFGNGGEAGPNPEFDDELEF